MQSIHKMCKFISESINFFTFLTKRQNYIYEIFSLLLLPTATLQRVRSKDIAEKTMFEKIVVLGC